MASNDNSQKEVLESPNSQHLKPTRSEFCFKELVRDITSSTENTIKFLQQNGVLCRNVVCPGPLVSNRRQFSCGREMCLKKTGDTKDAYMWRCRRAHTVVKETKTYKTKDVKLTVRYLSWLVDVKLPLTSLLELMYCWANSYPSREILKECAISRRTLVEWSHFFRECCYYVTLDCSKPIGGPGIEVEIDESKFGKRKYYKGHEVEGTWVFGGREKKDKTKVFMVPVMTRSTAELIPHILKWIAPGSIIHSDGWAVYKCLPKYGYKHLPVNHKRGFKNWYTGACTNGIESDWRHAKVSLPTYGVHRGLHAGYLATFMWKRKNYGKDLFMELLKDVNFTFKQKWISGIPSDFGTAEDSIECQSDLDLSLEDDHAFWEEAVEPEDPVK